MDDDYLHRRKWNIDSPICDEFIDKDLSTTTTKRKELSLERGVHFIERATMFDNVRTKLNIRFTPFRTYERFQNETDQLFFHYPEEKEKDESTNNGLTALEAAWNVTNAIQVRRASRLAFSSRFVSSSRECS